MLLTAFAALALAWWGERRNQSITATRYQLHVNGEQASVVDSAADQVTLFSGRANPNAAIDPGIQAATPPDR
jgi:hypothetical protein